MERERRKCEELKKRYMLYTGRTESGRVWRLGRKGTRMAHGSRVVKMRRDTRRNTHGA